MRYKRNIIVTLREARAWYCSGNDALKEIASRGFTEEELIPFDFTQIKTFDDAVRMLYEDVKEVGDIYFILHNLESISKASAASFKLNIIRKALNYGKGMSFGERNWYPHVSCIKSEYNFNNEEKKNLIAEHLLIEETNYDLVSGFIDKFSLKGLGRYDNGIMVCCYNVGCATEEISNHFERYFAKEIFEAEYGDFVEYEFI